MGKSIGLQSLVLMCFPHLSMPRRGLGASLRQGDDEPSTLGNELADSENGSASELAPLSMESRLFFFSPHQLLNMSSVFRRFLRRLG